jgi:dTDP-6-deoxy-L-talose 4-dehydrogenase (NAD+)
MSEPSKSVHIVGAGGFIGSAIKRIEPKLDDVKLIYWGRREKKFFDLLAPESWEALADARPGCVVLLAWPGLPHYNEPYHVTRNLPLSLQLVLRLAESSMKRIVIAGSCYEYGLQNGQLGNHHATQPVNQYAIAKDCLRRSVEALAAQLRLEYQWLRIFYPFGEGQNPNSFLPSLDRAIERGEHAFEMSSGRQIRDFLPVEDVARHLVLLGTRESASGTYNSGSGVPASLREIAETRIIERASNISLKLGVYPDRLDEPLAFWADMSRMHALMQSQPF